MSDTVECPYCGKNVERGMDMENNLNKAVVTQKQAEHIKYFERDRYYALEHKVNGTFSSSGCLDELSLDELAIALYVGYEV